MADCQFDPTLWAHRKNVRFLSDAQREDAYLRALPFLLEQMEALIEKGWTRMSDKPNDDGILFDLTHFGEEKLTLPSTFNALLDASKEDTWRTIFTNPWVFFATSKEDDERDVFIDSATPLRNIFYLFQVLAPGMLVIYRDGNEDECKAAISRVLPPKSWIEENYHSVEEIMGDMSMSALLGAAEDQNIAYYNKLEEDVRYDEQSPGTDDEEDFDDYDNYYDQNHGSDNEHYVDMWGIRQPFDLTACSSECGYCGRCDY